MLVVVCVYIFEIKSVTVSIGIGLLKELPVLRWYSSKIKIKETMYCVNVDDTVGYNFMNFA